MAAELVQRQRLLRRTYTLTADGIRVSERTLLSGRTLTVPYELMFGNREEVLTTSKRLFWLTAVLAAVAIAVAVAPNAERLAWLFWLLLAAVSGAAFVASRRDQIGFSDAGVRILFLRDCPSREALDDFLGEARRQARERVRARLLPLGRSDNPRFDRQRAAWLREKGIITRDEHAEFERALGDPADGPRPADRSLN